MVYDIIVIGAGVEGSATAYYSAKQGAKTLLLEQFALPHSHGSSHGQTRVIRRSYNQVHYAKMMGDAYKMWEELEKECNIQLKIKCGLLNIGQTKRAALKTTQDILDGLGIPYTYLKPHELKTRFPQFHFDEKYSVVFDPDGGILYADRACLAYQKRFQELGGHLNDAAEVIKIIPGISTVTIHTINEMYQCKSVIVTAGPWTNKVLAPMGLQLPLQVRKVAVLFWKVPREKYMYQAKFGFPTFHKTTGDSDYDKTTLYGLPDTDDSGMIKICTHNGRNIDLDGADHQVDSAAIKQVSAFIKDHMPGVAREPSIIESCLYTVSPDHDFILDAIPGHSNIIVGAGFSGHGFKLAPVVGKVLFELATGKQHSYDLSPFKINRFKEKFISKI